MRVLWISVFIFLVVVLISLVLHEPAENKPVLQSSLGVSQPSDPFVSEPFVSDKVQDKQVELAALPGEPLNADEMQSQLLISPDASQSDGSQPEATQSLSADSSSSEDGQNLTTADVQQADAVADAESHTNNVAINDSETIVSTNATEASNATEATELETSSTTRPLGLLARSIEKKKNQNKLAVIVHLENNQQLTIDEIRGMYLDKITHWQDGSRIMLYNLPLGDSHREKFSQNILNMSALEADEAESERRDNHVAINSVRVKAKNIVVSYVERDPNAIAYVPLSLVRDKSNVKVIATFP